MNKTDPQALSRIGSPATHKDRARITPTDRGPSSSGLRIALHWVKGSPATAYFVLAFATSWAIELLLVAGYNDLLSAPMSKVPMQLHYLAAFGPGLAGIIVAAATGGRQALMRLLRSLVKWRVGWKWLALGCLSPLVVVSAAALVNYASGGTWPDLQTVGNVQYLGNIGIPAALLLWLGTFGFAEETGWRGFALPTLQKRYSPLIAALIVGAFWALWHLPMFFYNPQYRALGLGGYLGFSLGVICGSIFLTWLYNRSSGSVLVVAVWHALFNLLTAASAFQGTIAAVTSTVVMVCAVTIVVVELWQRYRTHSGRTVMGPTTPQIALLDRRRST